MIEKMKTYYIQLDQNNIIRDVVEMPVDGYMEVQIEDPLPVGIKWRVVQVGKRNVCGMP